MPEPLYRRLADDRVLATEATQGPWDPAAQHGGAPGALVAGLAERFENPGGLRIARLTIELLRPVPITELRVAIGFERPGRNVQLVRVSLHAGEDDTEVLRALALRLRRGEGPAVGWEPEREPPRPGPDATQIPEWRPAGRFASATMDVRPVRGSAAEPGSALVWFRLTVPALDDEPLSPVQRAAAAADFGNGVGSVLSWDDWAFINPDLTVTLERDPVGEWIGLDAATATAADGTGVAESVLLDEQGRFGRAVQTLLIAPRRH